MGNALDQDRKVIKTIKIRLYPDSESARAFQEMMEAYRDACNAMSEYMFSKDVHMGKLILNTAMYHHVREVYRLKSQMAQSAARTVKARYKAVDEFMKQHPYRFRDKEGVWHTAERTVEWLKKPIYFSKPQVDLVHRQDYSFTDHGTLLSINTLGKRRKISFTVPEYFQGFLDDGWKLGTAHILCRDGKWYLHIPATAPACAEAFDPAAVRQVVGIDRGLRFLAVTYDGDGKCLFLDGKAVMDKRDRFRKVRAGLQSKGTKSAKRVLKRISGRENRWMADVNHRASKTLVQKYGAGTLFVVEDLTDVSFDQRSLSKGDARWREKFRSWAFFQFGQFLTYKADAAGSFVLSVPEDYTSQRCPKCGRIRKENRKHGLHEYICDRCGYRSNDDRIGAMNIHALGMRYVGGDPEPHFTKPEMN